MATKLTLSGWVDETVVEGVHFTRRGAVPPPPVADIISCCVRTAGSMCGVALLLVLCAARRRCRCRRGLRHRCLQVFRFTSSYRDSLKYASGLQYVACAMRTHLPSFR